MRIQNFVTLALTIMFQIILTSVEGAGGGMLTQPNNEMQGFISQIMQNLLSKKNIGNDAYY